MSRKRRKNQTHQPTVDKMQNLVTGMGTKREKVQSTKITNPLTLTELEIDSLYTDNWAFGKAVDLVAKDMVRPWRTVTNLTTEESRKFSAIERKFKIRTKLLDLVTNGRKQGSCILVIGDSSKRLDTPIDRDKVKMTYLNVVFKEQLVIQQELIIEDISNEYYGYPEFYIRKDDTSKKIHVSRTIRFDHIKPSINIAKYFTNWWGISLSQRMFDAITKDEAISSGLVQMAEEMNLDVISIPKLVKMASSKEGIKQIKARFEDFADLKSLYKIIIKDAEEGIDRKAISFTGTRDLSETYINRLAASANIPLTKFYGTSAKGMNSTGEGDEDDYDEMVKNEIELKIRPIMEELDPILARAAGVTEDIAFVWNPLKLPSEENIADVNKIRMETAKIAIEQGIVTADEVREDIIDKKWFISVTGKISTKGNSNGENQDN